MTGGLSYHHSGDPGVIHDYVVYHMQAPLYMPTQRICPSLETAKQRLCPQPDTTNTHLCPVLHFPNNSNLLSFSEF